MKTITVEEHFATEAFLAGPGRPMAEQARGGQGLSARIPEQLLDLGDGRLREMDEAGIDMQVLSLNSPGVEQSEPAEAIALARESNDALAKAITAHPDRFSGFAAVPTPDPEAAAAELERAVKELGLKGAIINGHVRGRYLDDPMFLPVFETAARLGVPLYLHPTQPPKPVVDTYFAGFSPQVSFMFANAGWGWHIETAVHVLRLILGGVFDRYPGLTLIVGHMGEGLPFMLHRVDNMRPAMTGLKQPVSVYLRQNLYYSFSGFNFPATFLDLFLEVGADRIMFSADYLYASMAAAREFLDRLPVSEADREKMAWGNAARVMGVR